MRESRGNCMVSKSDTPNCCVDYESFDDLHGVILYDTFDSSARRFEVLRTVDFSGSTVVAASLWLFSPVHVKIICPYNGPTIFDIEVVGDRRWVTRAARKRL